MNVVSSDIAEKWRVLLNMVLPPIWLTLNLNVVITHKLMCVVTLKRSLTIWWTCPSIFTLWGKRKMALMILWDCSFHVCMRPERWWLEGTDGWFKYKVVRLPLLWPMRFPVWMTVKSQSRNWSLRLPLRHQYLGWHSVSVSGSVSVSVCVCSPDRLGVHRVLSSCSWGKECYVFTIDFITLTLKGLSKAKLDICTKATIYSG